MNFGNKKLKTIPKKLTEKEFIKLVRTCITRPQNCVVRRWPFITPPSPCHVHKIEQTSSIACRHNALPDDNLYSSLDDTTVKQGRSYQKIEQNLSLHAYPVMQKRKLVAQRPSASHADARQNNNSCCSLYTTFNDFSSFSLFIFASNAHLEALIGLYSQCSNNA